MEVSMIKKAILLLVALVICTLMVGLFQKLDNVYAQTETQNAIKLEVTIPEPYRTGSSGSVLSARMSLFGWQETGALQPGDKLVYEVFSPTPIPGIGSFDGQFQTTWVELSSHIYERDLKDVNAISMKPETDLSSYIGNGWYRREFVFDATLTEPNITGPYLCHYVLGFKITAPVNYDKIVVYYRNIYIERSNGTKVTIFGDSSVVAPQSYPAYPDTVDLSSNFTVTTTEQPVIPIINVDNLPSFALQNTEVDVSNVTVQNGGTFSVSVLDETGKVVTVTNNKFTPVTSGKYTIVISGSLNGINTKSFKEIEVVPESHPWILEEDVKQITADGNAGIAYNLPKIKAMLNGVKTLDTTVKVYDSNDQEIVVTDNGSTWSFIPIPKKNDQYRIVYTAQTTIGGEVVQHSRTVIINIYDNDKPTIDVSNVPTSIQSGTVFVLPEVVATDPSDGEITTNRVVYDPFGDEVSVLNNRFVANVAGYYVIRYTATDSDNNTTVKEVKVNSVKQVGQVIHLRVYIPEELRPAGIRKAVRVSLGYVEDNFQYDLFPGDKIFYSFYSPNLIPGIGGFEGQFKGSWAHFSQRGFYDQTDQNGISMDPTTDLSNYFKDGWYYREIPVTQEMIDDFTIAHYVLVINTTAEVGEYIDLYYKNIGVIDVTGSIDYFFDGTNALKPEYYGVDSHDPQGIYKSLEFKMFAEYDPFPIVNIDNLPSYIEVGKPFTIQENIFFDYQDQGPAKEQTYKVIDPKGNEVTVTNGTFTPILKGYYTIIVTGKDTDNHHSEATFELEAKDLTKPKIIINGELKNIKKGDEISLPAIIVTDNVDENIIPTIEVFDPSGNKVEINNDKFIVKQVGTYTVKVTARDSSRNTDTVEFTFDVEKNHSIYFLIGGVVIIVGLLTGGILVFLKKRK